MQKKKEKSLFFTAARYPPFENRNNQITDSAEMRENMKEDIILFFEKHIDALPLYQALESQIINEIKNTSIKVQKSQISFYNKHLFACVSFTQIRKKKDCPANFIVVTFGLKYKLQSPRIEITTEPYPQRWTHHLLLSDTREIDDELMLWLKEAAAFSSTK